MDLGGELTSRAQLPPTPPPHAPPPTRKSSPRSKNAEPPPLEEFAKMEPLHVGEMANIKCCICGLMIQPNAANTCAKCLQSEVDITDRISKELMIFRCRGCSAWFQNPAWVQCELESRKLLALCLKKIKGLKQVKLVDAGFIWTEPHSMRVKLKVTIQKEAKGVILQQSFPVVFVIKNKQCDDCAASYTEHTWMAQVQVRQKVRHKRTFFFLEQLILKHNMASACMGIQEHPDGLDFFFGKNAPARRLQDFLQSCVPVKTKESKRLISQDFKNNTVKHKFTIYVEISPVCRDALVCLPHATSRKFGGLGPILLCTKVTQSLHLLDPTTLQKCEMSSAVFFSAPFGTLGTQKQLSRFVVMDMTLQDKRVGKWRLAEVELQAEDDVGGDKTFDAVTHLGNYLQVGDLVGCYDLTTLVINEPNFRKVKKTKIPELVVVRKLFDKRRKKRKWKLKQLTVEQVKRTKVEQMLYEGDRERFMQELEEDIEMRGQVNLYKRQRSGSVSSVGSSAAGDGAPTVGLDELLTEMDGMHMTPKEDLRTMALPENTPLPTGIDEDEL